MHVDTLEGVSVSPSGEAAVRVVAASGNTERDWRVVHHLARALAAAEHPGLHGTIPSYESALVEFDPLLLSTDAVMQLIDHVLETIDAAAPLVTTPRRFVIPVVYGGERGPDLDEVGSITGLHRDEVIERHLAPNYTVRCLGAPGGSPMLDGPDFPLPVPRLTSPRPFVRRGSVSVAGRQATIAPTDAPGGWRVIGWTPLRLVDLTDGAFVPYVPGDLLRFEAITAERARELEGTRLQPEVLR